MRQRIMFGKLQRAVLYNVQNIPGQSKEGKNRQRKIRLSFFASLSLFLSLFVRAIEYSFPETFENPSTMQGIKVGTKKRSCPSKHCLTRRSMSIAGWNDHRYIHAPYALRCVICFMVFSSFRKQMEHVLKTKKGKKCKEELERCGFNKQWALYRTPQYRTTVRYFKDESLLNFANSFLHRMPQPFQVSYLAFFVFWLSILLIWTVM